MRMAIFIGALMCALAGCRPAVVGGAGSGGSATRGKASGPVIGSCAKYTAFRDDFCWGAGCRPSLAQMVDYIGGLICAGSSDASTLRGNCSAAVWDLQTGERASYHGDEASYAASTIKLVIVAAALYYGTPPSAIEADARAIFGHSSNTAPARVLDALQRVLPAGERAADRVNAFLHDVAGASACSQFTRWCPAGETCHVASRCGAVARCGYEMPFLTANDALRVLWAIENTAFAGQATLHSWAATREQEPGLYGVRSCGLSELTIEHKVGSLWFDDTGLTYNDAAIITLPGRAPLLVAFFDGYQGHQGQQGKAAFALVRLVRDGVVDFSGQALPAAGSGSDAGPADARSDIDVSGLGDPRAACQTVHQIDTCSRKRADTLLTCQPNIDRFTWVRCPQRCVPGGYMKPDHCM